MGLCRRCLVLLLASVWFATIQLQVEAQRGCSQGNATCAGVNNTVTTGNFTWCCPTPAAGMVPNIAYYSATNQTCTCITEAENMAQLEAQIILWADTTKDSGRMCNAGDRGCSGSESNSTVNNKFKYCCPKADHTNITITIFSGTDSRYIGCRCPSRAVPQPGYKQYRVPPTGLVNATGESCSYNIWCLDNPPLSCSDAATRTTLCCYGSRGMQVVVDGETTKCSCTNELYQTSCPTSIRQIPGEEPGNVKECSKGGACFRYEKGVVPAGVTEKDSVYYCCLDRNFTRVGFTLNNGSEICRCKQALTLDSEIRNWTESTRDQGRMCTRGPENCKGAWAISVLNRRQEFTTCCWKSSFNSSVNIPSSGFTVDGDKFEFQGCRCVNWPVPTPAPGAYLVPGARTDYKSTGESCSHDAACGDHPALKCQAEAPRNVTFCCYGSRGMVTTNVDGQYTGCTCTDELYGESCERQPVPVVESAQPCQPTCSNLTQNTDTCSDAAHDVNRKCCLSNLVAVGSSSSASQCQCLTREKHCLGLTASSGPPLALAISALVLLPTVALSMFGG